MLSTFCLRLAWGMIATLLLLSRFAINPRYYRTHFLTALALTGAAAVMTPPTASTGTWVALGVALAGALFGSLAWSLEGAPGGRWWIGWTAVSLGALLVVPSPSSEARPSEPGFVGGVPYACWRAADQLTSGALLGTATSAMLMGHSYLIAPGMSVAPLMRLLNAFFAALVIRLAAAALGLWSWGAGHSLVNVEDVAVLWLPLRWGLGFVGPLVLGWMARETARIRSTQSATGILYVVVVFCFLGELTSLLLVNSTSYLLWKGGVAL